MNYTVCILKKNCDYELLAHRPSLALFDAHSSRETYGIFCSVILVRIATKYRQPLLESSHAVTFMIKYVQSRHHPANNFFTSKCSCKMWCVSWNTYSLDHFHSPVVQYHSMDFIDDFVFTCASTIKPFLRSDDGFFTQNIILIQHIKFVKVKIRQVVYL